MVLLRFRAPGLATDLAVDPGAPDRTLGDAISAVRQATGIAPESHVAGGDPVQPVWVDGRPVDPHADLGAVLLVDGTVVALSQALTDPGWCSRGLAVIGGLDAGTWVPVQSGRTLSLGRARDNDLVVDDPSVSRRHGRIEVTATGAAIEAERAGTVFVAGTAVSPGRRGRVTDGQPFECGAAMLVITERHDRDRPAALDQWRAQAAATGGPAVPFYRPPAERPQRAPTRLEVPTAPDEPAGRSGMAITSMVVPIAMGGAMVAITHHLEYALFALMSPVLGFLTMGESRARRRRSARAGRAAHRQEADEFLAAVRSACREEEVTRRRDHPTLAELARWASTPSTRLWERRPDHPEAWVVSLGTGDVRWAPPHDTDALDAGLAAAVEPAARLHSVPITVSLSAGTFLGVAGDEERRTAIARGAVLQSAVLHGPADLTVAVVTSEAATSRWDWAKWLPHARPPGSRHPWLFCGATASERLGRSLRAGRPAGHVLLVVDADADPSIAHQAIEVLHRSGCPGGGIVLSASRDSLPARCNLVLALAPAEAEASLTTADGQAQALLPTGAGASTAERVAADIAGFSDPEDHRAGGGAAPVRLSQLLGLDPPVPGAVRARWAGTPPLQMMTRGEGQGAVAIPLAGEDPHLVVSSPDAGARLATLTTVVASLVADTDPSQLHLVLVGRALAPLAGLPHVTAHVDEAAAETLLPRQLDSVLSGPSQAALAVVVADVEQLQATGELIRVLRSGRPRLHVVAAGRPAADRFEPLGSLPAQRLTLLGGAGPLPAEVPAAVAEAGAGAAWWSARDGGRLVYPPAIDAPAANTGSTVVTPFAFVAEPSEEPVVTDLDALLTAVRAAAEDAGLSAPPLAELAQQRTETPAVDLPTLLGLADVSSFDPVTMWQAWPPDKRLRVPIGLRSDGQPLELDLKEAAHGGHGPHGVVVGATGSGKSELLRTLVTSLALAHTPEAVSCVLVDFKGGATFAGLSDLPHVAGMVTNLEGDLGGVDRVREALTGEMLRRQRVLEEAGVDHVATYQQRRRERPELEPLPTLLVIIDEFVELLSNVPDFVELFLNIGRVGRSIGVSLLLASQQLEEGRLKGLDRNLRYRVALRTETALESRSVLNVPDAATLPPDPGLGYLRVGNDLAQFRSAYVAGPSGPPPAPTVMAAAVDRLREAAPRTRQVCLPPLEAGIDLQGLLGQLVTDEARGLHAHAWPGTGRLIVPVGRLDQPAEQQQPPLALDLRDARGNVAVVGSPQTGKSTLVRTLVTSLALTHTPTEVQCYVLDLGGGTLAPLAGLPHVGVVAAGRDTNLVRRTVAELERILDAREALFKDHNIDSPATLRALRSAGRLPDEELGDVFLVIDGWATFRQQHEGLEAAVTAIAARGLSYGIHVVVATARWADLRAAMQDSFGSRLELRLNNPGDSAIDRRAASRLRPQDQGRVLTTDRLAGQVALPSYRDHATFEQLIGLAASAWDADGAPPIRLLPDLVELPSLPPAAPAITLGISEADMGPVNLDLRRGGPHLVVFGDGSAGKTTALAALVAGITSLPPEESQMAVVDYRRGLLGLVPPSHLLGYGPSAPAAKDLVDSLRPILEARRPGVDVTPEQLRNRSWWDGPDLYLVVDDYDLVAGSPPTPNPLASLLDLLPQAADVGLHVILARRTSGMVRAGAEPFLSRLREAGTGLILSGDRAEGPLLGPTRAAEQPPGRGLLVRPRQPVELVQVAVPVPPG
jgi:S-DNA-T family DNA segregation ATPase FtsK/SpoIIIE